MSVEIHSAIVGGAIAGLVVLLGVSAEHFLRNRLAATERVRESVRRLPIVLPRLLTPLSELTDRREDLPTASPQWQSYSDEILEILHCVRFDTPRRIKAGTRRSDVRTICDDIEGRVSGLTLRFSAKGWAAPVTRDEVLDTMSRVADLISAIVGPREHLNDQIRSTIDGQGAA